jgi:GH25 family lysozyme M1 (1,4-beta-N-acetylmuramidase)
MNTLLDRHKDLVDFLSKTNGAFSLEDLLTQFFFNEQQGRALIFQNIDRYAVLYLKKELFTEEKEKGEQIEKFWDLITFIKYLKDNHYIYPVFSHDMDEKIVILHDVFKDPKIEKNRIVLDEDGDFTSQPEMINSKEGDVLYEGVIYKKDYYKSIANNVLGTFKKATIFEKLLNQPKEEEKDVEEPTPAEEPTVKNTELEKKEKDKEAETNSLNDTEDAPKTSTETAQPDNKEDVPKTKVDPTPVDVKKNEDLPLQKLNVKTTSNTKEAPNTLKLKDHLKRLASKASLLLIPVLGLLGYQGVKLHYGMDSLMQRNELITQKLHRIDSLLKRNTNAVSPVATKGAVKTKTWYGIDISRYNENVVDDIALSDSIHFVICKATQGAYYVDPYFLSNWKALEDKKMIKGAYHFYDPGVDPIKQAKHFLNVATFSNKDITPIVDIEKDSVGGKPVNIDTLNVHLKRFLEFVKDKTKRTPMIYVGSYFANTYLKDPTFDQYPLWLADYTRKSTPRIPKIWQSTGFKIWQKTDDYDLKHIKNCLDVFYGDITSLTSD